MGFWTEFWIVCISLSQFVENIRALQQLWEFLQPYWDILRQKWDATVAAVVTLKDRLEQNLAEFAMMCATIVASFLALVALLTAVYCLSVSAVGAYLYSEVSSAAFVTIFGALPAVSYIERRRGNRQLLRWSQILAIFVLVVIWYYSFRGLFALAVAVHLYCPSEKFFTLVTGSLIFGTLVHEYASNASPMRVFLQSLSAEYRSSERWVQISLGQWVEGFLTFIGLQVPVFYLSSGLLALLVSLDLRLGWSSGTVFVTFVVIISVAAFGLLICDDGRHPGVSGGQGTALTFLYCIQVGSTSYVLWRLVFALAVTIHFYSRLPSKVIFKMVAPLPAVASFFWLQELADQ